MEFPKDTYQLGEFCGKMHRVVSPADTEEDASKVARILHRILMISDKTESDEFFKGYGWGFQEGQMGCALCGGYYEVKKNNHLNMPLCAYCLARLS